MGYGMSHDAQPTILLCSLGVQYSDSHHAAPHLSVPLSLGYLVGGMEASGLLARCRVEILGPFESLFAADGVVVRAIARRAPAILGFSCYCWNIGRSLFIAERVKRLRPNTKIVLGGPEATERANDLLERHPWIDAVVRGEGEESFSELVDDVLSNKNTPPPPGCLVRVGGELIDGGARDPVKEPGRFPSPYLRGYLDPLPYGSLNIETVRGCTFRCDYCYYPKGIRELRSFPVDRIRAEVQMAAFSGVRRGYLMDPVFNLPDRIEEVCLAVAEANVDRRIEFQTEVRAELIDRNAVSLLRRANIGSVEVGLQSTNIAALRGVHRGFSSDHFASAVSMMAAAGISVHVGIIIGLPGDGFADMDDTLDYALGLPVAGVHCFLLQVLPGTALFRRAAELGIEFDPEPPYFVRRTPRLDERDLTSVHAHALRRVRDSGRVYSKPPKISGMFAEGAV